MAVIYIEWHDGIVKAAQHRKRGNSSLFSFVIFSFVIERVWLLCVFLYSFARRLVLSKEEKKKGDLHPPSDGYDEILGMRCWSGWNDSHMLPHYTLSNNNQKKWMKTFQLPSTAGSADRFQSQDKSQYFKIVERNSILNFKINRKLMMVKIFVSFSFQVLHNNKQTTTTTTQ